MNNLVYRVLTGDARASDGGVEVRSRHRGSDKEMRGRIGGDKGMGALHVKVSPVNTVTYNR